jgi:hypothetical protein
MSKSPPEEFSAALMALQKHYRQMFDDIGPVPDRGEQFLAKLHGPGWKERALAAGDPKTSLGYSQRLSDLEERVGRIERHLKLEPIGK